MTTDRQPDFEVVYHTDSPLPIRLEAAAHIDAAGNPYRHHRLVIANGRPGSVIIASRGGELLLVRSYRAAVGAHMWELPRGVGEEVDAERGDDSGSASAGARTGQRELLEETGYTAHRTTPLGEYVTDSAVFPQRVTVVHCEIAPDATPVGGDGEVDEVRWNTTGEVVQMMRSGAIRDAHSLAGLALWLLHAPDVGWCRDR